MTAQDHINHMNDITVNFATTLSAEQQNAADTAVTVARENIEWLVYHGDSISEWLVPRVGVSGASGVSKGISLIFFVIASLSFSYKF